MPKVGTVTVPFCATLHFRIQLDCLTLHRIRWSEWLFLALSHHNTLRAALSNPWLFPYLCSLSWNYSCRLVPSLRSYLHCASLPLIRSLKQFPQEPLKIQKQSSRSAMNQLVTDKLFVPFKNIGMPCILRFQISDIIIFQVPAIFAKCMKVSFCEFSAERNKIALNKMIRLQRVDFNQFGPSWIITFPSFASLVWASYAYHSSSSLPAMLGRAYSLLRL